MQIAQLQEYVERLPYDVLVYDCVDNYTGFPENKAFYRTVTTKTNTEKQDLVAFLETLTDKRFVK